jgi:L-arabinose isomerase
LTLEVRKEAEIWFLTGSQGLYGEETLKQVAEQSQEVVRMLDQNPEVPIKIVWKPVLLTPDTIRRACLDASANDNCLGVIVWMHTFSPSKMWIAGLLALQKPLLHFNTQINSHLPWATLDMDFMNLNQAAHGDREHGHIAARLNIPRKVVVGHASDQHTVTRISDWVHATIGWDTAQHLKLARFGDNMRFVAVTDGDKTSAQMRFGISIEAYGVNALVETVESATKAQIDSVVDEYLSLYDVAPELQKNGDRHESLRYGAAIEVGLYGFLKAGGFSAFTTNFEDLGGLRQLPGLAVQRMMAKGYGFGGEGDWKTSALLTIVKSMARGRTGGSTFMEDYAYHFGPGEPKILGAHMLEVCPTITSRKPKIEIHPLAIGDREDPVRMVFNADPGEGQVIALMDLGNRFRIVANSVEVVDPDIPLQKITVACAVWKPRPSLATSAESWIYAGGSHHTVLTTALGPETLADFAKIAGVELLVIDEDTRVDQFQREMRWNASHFSYTGN